MKDIEDFIGQNRDEFDRENLPSGHEDRFAQKLKTQKQAASHAPLWKAAAGFALLFGLVFWLSQYYQDEPTATSDHQADSTMSELAEIEAFYQDRVQAAEQQTLNASDSVHTELQNQLEVLEASYRNLKTELERTNGDQRVLFRIIENYQLRLELLKKHFMIMQEKSSQHNTKDHENS